MNFAIETDGLSKSYGTVHAVESVDLRVREGEIYGFLGLNGAGKTTTIRALLGMIRPSAGAIRVLGHALGPRGMGPWSRVGHLVEMPAAYPELTVFENLEIARRLHGIEARDVTHRVIEALGLSTFARRKAAALSSGNLQRLALARALLHGPDLLILDEPANGLDPAGVVEIRELIARLSRDNGVTVFMSSHILTEVDRLATRIGIIHRGRLIEELDSEKLKTLRSQRLEVSVRNPDAGLRALAASGFAVERDGSTLLLKDPRAIEAPDAVATLLVTAGTPPLRLSVLHEDLEEHFLRLTGGVS